MSTQRRISVGQHFALTKPAKCAEGVWHVGGVSRGWESACRSFDGLDLSRLPVQADDADGEFDEAPGSAHECLSLHG